LDVGIARGPGRIKGVRDVAKLWREGKSRTGGEGLKLPGRVLTVGHGGSTLGNMDLLLPHTYPLSRSESEPVLRLLKSETRLHCRPGELYLGAATSRGQLRVYVFWDGNVYHEDVIKEWLDEVKGAMEQYLVQANESPIVHARL